MEAVDALLDGVKPLFDEVPVSVVHPTAQPQPIEDSPIAERIGQKCGVLAGLTFTYSVEERSRWIRAVTLEDLGIENRLCTGSIAAYTQHRSPLIRTAVSSIITRDGDPSAGRDCCQSADVPTGRSLDASVLRRARQESLLFF
jgi:hypothetical protein